MLTQRRLWCLALGVIVLMAVAAYGRTAPRLVTDSDFALAELHTELAARGDLRVGPYSRMGWNHPGPLLAYIQAPFYVAGGRNAVSMFAVAIVINLSALGLIAWCAWRSESSWMAVALVAACLLFAWRAPRVLASPWSGHIGVLPAMAALVLAAGVASGRARLFPPAIAAGSFAVQTHLALAPMIAAVCAIAAVAAWRAHPRIVAVAGLVWIALWSPPLLDAALHRGGNLAALWRFFVSQAGEGHSFAESLRAWSAGLAGVWRSGFALPWGGHLAVDETSWMLPLAIAQMALLPAIALPARRAGRAFDASLAWCAWAASLAGLAAVTRIEGAFLDHEIFWLAPLGVINVAIIAAAIARIAAPAALTRARQASAIACATLLAVGAVLAVVQLRDLVGFESRRTTPRRIPLAHQAIRDYMSKTGATRLMIDMQDDAWAEGAGIVLRLHQEGVAVAVPGSHLAMFTPRFRSRGWEDARITISPREGQHAEQLARPGNVTLLEANPVFVNAIRIVPGR